MLYLDLLLALGDPKRPIDRDWAAWVVLQEDAQLLNDAMQQPPELRHYILQRMALYDAEKHSEMTDKHYGKQRIVTDAHLHELVAQIEDYICLTDPTIARMAHERLIKTNYPPTEERQQRYEQRMARQKDIAKQAFEERDLAAEGGISEFQRMTESGLANPSSLKRERESGHYHPRLPLRMRDMLLDRKIFLIEQDIANHIHLEQAPPLYQNGSTPAPAAPVHARPHSHAAEIVDWSKLEHVTREYGSLMKDYIDQYEMLTRYKGYRMHDAYLTSTMLQFRRVLGQTDEITQFFSRIVEEDLQQLRLQSMALASTDQFRPRYQEILELLPGWGLPKFGSMRGDPDLDTPEKREQAIAARVKHISSRNLVEDTLSVTRRYSLPEEIGITPQQRDNPRMLVQMAIDFTELTHVMFHAPFTDTLRAISQKHAIKTLTENGHFAHHINAFDANKMNDYLSPSLFVQNRHGAGARPAGVYDTLDILDNLASLIESSIGQDRENWNCRLEARLEREAADDGKSGASWLATRHRGRITLENNAHARS